MDPIQKPIIIQTNHVYKSFKKSGDQAFVALSDINLTLYEGEIVALLGKSGSGKSTLLRIIAGLIQPNSGQAYYRSTLIEKPVVGISMVFQHFALMPWLTVLQNVELGLEAQGVARKERRRRAIEAIDIIGLDGFESAYPKELSGGMRQRVGIARAFVVNPDLLLMDEPFSALDVLTADNLKSDLIDLWQNRKAKINGILLVTHNIEEAVMLADRIIIMSSDPGTLRHELAITLPHPRNHLSAEFHHYVDRIYTLMTSSRMEALTHRRHFKPQKMDISVRLPDVNVSELTGLLETLNAPEYGGKLDLPVLADLVQMNIDDLFPLNELLELLQFARVSQGDIELTEVGKEFADADILGRKQIFAQQLMQHVPLANYIRSVLDEKTDHYISADRFLSELEDYFSEDEAERILRTVIDWGRYAEIFAYDSNEGMLSLENPH